MINITDKQKCSGCYACYNICPEKCIEMQLDKEGFRYPVVDINKCINCNLCSKVCHYLGGADEVKKSHKARFSAACYAKDDEVLKKSASGGIAAVISKLVISSGGVVFGVKGNAVTKVEHTMVTDLEGLKEIRNSKYLQSHIDRNFTLIKEKLNEGKVVFFVGTPCQVAGLYGYLGKDYENLLTADLICHGVPSETVFKKYIEEHEMLTGKKVVSFARDKKPGWKPVYFSYLYDDGSVFTEIGRKDLFNMGFTTNLFQRPTCYSCSYANMARIGDITLGDWFGGEKHKTFDPKNKGLSMISINSDKGEKVYNAIRPEIASATFDVGEAVIEGEHFGKPPQTNFMRRDFYKYLDKKSYMELHERYFPKNKTGMLRNAILRRLYRLIYKNNMEKFFK